MRQENPFRLRRVGSVDSAIDSRSLLSALPQTRSPSEASELRRDGVFGRLFEPVRFHKEHEDCVICMMPYNDDDMVTALPCDSRHYFHRDCVQ
mmetsp:Transcript_18585/g.23110  ORF Transcript_18585/g.23110 Transcript_18585/m.23110 type:complete len:93 (-) Transcript_18585:314-592(-)